MSDSEKTKTYFEETSFCIWVKYECLTKKIITLEKMDFISKGQKKRRDHINVQNKN